MTTALADLKLHSSGKVREMYEVDGDLLMVASDRISAYDVVLPTPIPDKGRVLTQMSVFWFETTQEIVPNHYTPQDVPDEVAGRALRVMKLEMYPVECVARGYLIGVGLAGVPRDRGDLRDRAAARADRVRPAPRADLHSGDQGRDRRPRREHRLRPSGRADRRPAADGGAPPGHAGPLHARRRARSRARDHHRRHQVRVRRLAGRRGRPRRRGAHARTPRASGRVDDYEPGRSQASFDKQYVRDWLDQSGWDHCPPGPELPEEVVAGTRAKYVEAYERITGRSLD